MTEIYGHKWISAFGDTPNEGWVACLTGLEPAMIKTGLSRMAEDGRFAMWPPAALEFRNLCLPRSEDVGLPGDEEAFRQSVSRNCRKHPAVIYTLRQMDQWSYQRMPAEKARAVFGKAWAQTVGYVFSGGDLPEPEPEIEHRHEKANPDVGRNYLDVLMDQFERAGL